MALIVQDNTGTVVNANGYISVAEFKAYHDDRGNAYDDFDDTQIGQALVAATDYIDSVFIHQFKGQKLSSTQTTEWPRNYVYDSLGNAVTGLPTKLKNACAEYAFRSLSADLLPDPTVDASGAKIISQTDTVGPITSSITYESGAAIQIVRPYPMADAMLVTLLMPTGRVYR